MIAPVVGMVMRPRGRYSGRDVNGRHAWCEVIAVGPDWVRLVGRGGEAFEISRESLGYWEVKDGS